MKSLMTLKTLCGNKILNENFTDFSHFYETYLCQWEFFRRIIKSNDHIIFKWFNESNDIWINGTVFYQILHIPHSNLHSETFEIDIAIGWTPQLEYWYYRVRIRSFTTIWYIAIHVQRLLLISAILIPVNLNSKIEFWHHYYLLHFCQSSSWIVVLEFIKWWCF